MKRIHAMRKQARAVWNTNRITFAAANGPSWITSRSLRGFINDWKGVAKRDIRGVHSIAFFLKAFILREKSLALLQGLMRIVCYRDQTGNGQYLNFEFAKI